MSQESKVSSIQTLWPTGKQWAILLGGFLLGMTLPLQLQAQKELNVITGWPRFHAAPNALYDHLGGEAYALLEKRNQRVRKLSTLAEWKQQQQRVRQTLLDMVGPFPEKTPLNARVVGTVDKPDFRIENIIFESQPGLFVTSSLFIPKGLPQGTKAPVILYASGHWKAGYRGPYTKIIQNLVKKGFIVFAWDPIGQGERLQYTNPKNGNSRVGAGTGEHAYATPPTFLTGSSLARYVIWDGIRAVDYLLTRPEIDPARIGMTGRSGGGYQSQYLAAFDDRIYATAPENHVTNLTRILQKIGPRDGEQNLFRMISGGIDHPDLLMVRAPKPTLIIATSNDIFNIDGTRETFEEVAAVYKALGKPENFAMVEDVAGHSSTEENNEAIYAFFQKHLKNPGSPENLTFEMLPDEDLRVTETGQVATSLNSETVYSFNRKRGEAQAAKLQEAWEKGSQTPAQVTDAAKKHSGYREPDISNQPVMTGSVRRAGYEIRQYFVKGEGEYPIPYLLFEPEKPNGQAILYLHPKGKAAQAGKEGEIESLVKQGYTVLAPDLVGTGEVGPGDWAGDKDFQHAVNAGLDFRIWHAAAFIGRSIVGVRAGDIVKLADILKNRGLGKIHAIAVGTMSPVLLHAAAFTPHISGIALVGPYFSYQSVVENEYYDPSFLESLVPGALMSYDLPYLAAALAPRRLVVHNPTDGAGKVLDEDALARPYAVVKKTFEKKGAAASFILSGGDNPQTAYQPLLKD